MIALFLRLRNEVGEAIDHHAGLGEDADDDTQDVCSRRDKAVGEEEPDGVDAKWDVDPERADLRQRLVATRGAHHVAVEEVEEAALYLNREYSGTSQAKALAPRTSRSRSSSSENRNFTLCRILMNT